MSDVASQSRGALKENNKATGSSQMEGSTNGDPQAVESPSSNATPPPPPPPLSNNSTISANKKGGTAAKKKTLDPTEVNSLLTAKISQLESDASFEEEEEKQIARAVRKANKDLAELVNSREDHFAKVEIIQQKYSDLLHEMKRLEREHTKARKRADQLQKEKDQSRTEMNKAVSLKSKLETLCRELQKENKRIKDAQDESKILAQSEKQKREELSNKFEETINEIKRRMDEETDTASRKSTLEADELFKAKFKNFVDQYEMRELHFYSLLRTKELEVQYNYARFEQQRKHAEAESSRAKALNSQVSTFSQTEAELRSQLNIYVDKFKQVEDTLNNSNDLFLTFRKEMEEMSKKTKRLEKENAQLTRKTELMNRNILEMAEERTRREKELNDYKKKYAKIEGICRALQSDRTDLQNKLRGVEGDLEEEEGEEGDEEEDYSGSEDGEHEGSEDFEGVEDDDDMTEDEAQVLERRGQGQQQRQHNHAKFTSDGWRKIANTAQTAVPPSSNPIHAQKGVAVSNAAS